MERARIQAIELAKQRWRLYHPFDLEDAQWDALFATYATGDILEAIKKTRDTYDTDPAVRYQRFERILHGLAGFRNRAHPQQ